MKLIKVIRRFLGYKYILNVKSGEVHFEDSIKKNCGVDKMKDSNKKYITKRQYSNLKYTYINKHVINGCRHCNTSTNTI